MERRKERERERELWDAAPQRAPLLAVRPELRLAALRRSLTAQVSSSAHPVGERAAAPQRLVR